MLVAWALTAMFTTEGQVVDMVVAQVGDDVVTLSELVAETGRVLVETRGPGVALEGGLPRSLLRSVLQSVVHNALLHREVDRLQLPAVSEDEVELEFARFIERFDDVSELTRFYDAYGFEPPEAVGKPPELLRRLLARRMRVDRFLEVRVGLGTKLPPGAVASCLKARPERFRGLSEREARMRAETQIRAQLEREKLEQILAELKEQTSVRYAPGFAPLAESAPTPEFVCPLTESSS
ncbi:MAG: hypothetical protein ACFB9M_20790 [Myxococcota bacterium]